MQSMSTTALSRDRTILANERTYAAWIRTGLAALAAGLAVERFMSDVSHPYSVRSVATILIVISLLAFFIAA